MDVLTIIKQEHREVGALIDDADGCDPGDQRLVELAREIEQKLSLHLAIEERLFYAQLRKRAEEQEQQVDVFEAYTEHAVARALMEMLRSGRKPDEKFKAELQVLGESVKHHVEEEESKVFSVAKKLLDAEELDAIGASWERAKQRGVSETSTRSPRPAARAGGAKKRVGAPRKKAAKKSAGRKTRR
ncbi:MAG TPA: hemerythrin domain-containing protein [Candidatus Sulfotelmatobacter sp.]|nr:hemerythrin domain-containing protein [Candidatus Sulfotelmatobacter sp.]